MKHRAFLFVLLLSNVVFSQIQTLTDYEIAEIYSESEANENVFENLDIGINTVSLYDVNSEFSSFEDLAWLKLISKENKVVLIGETHYSKNIGNLKNRIIFALNTFDYFPLVIIEREYSSTPFLNHFIQLTNKKEANTFFKDELGNMIKAKEDSIFIEHLRYWNQQNPHKKIELGCIDLEWSYDKMLEEILKPYFYKLKETDKDSIDKIIELGKNQPSLFFLEIEPLLAEAKKQDLPGAYPFIDPQFIENVIDNFLATYNALTDSFDYHRQKSLINKIEDDKYFGKYYKNQKVIAYGGGEHMKSKHMYPDGENFLSEGSYLNYDFKFTKGRVFSIMLSGLSFSLGEMKDIDLRGCVGQGTQYNSILKRMQDAYKANVLQADKNYFLFGQRTDFEKFIISKSYSNPAMGIIIPREEWNKISEYYPEFNSETREEIDGENKERNDFDTYIYIPYSPITIARKTIDNNVYKK